MIKLFKNHFIGNHCFQFAILKIFFVKFRIQNKTSLIESAEKLSILFFPEAIMKFTYDKLKKSHLLKDF